MVVFSELLRELENESISDDDKKVLIQRLCKLKQVNKKLLIIVILK